MMHLTPQVQLEQIVSSAVSQARTQHAQQTVSNPPLAAVPLPVQQVKSPINFDVPVFEGDSAASWLTWSQRVVVVYQARAYGSEALN